ncbi:MAG TPA: hypothetical protein VGJ63_12170 [Micromonosporaceae bacterium]|jgi:hypothetical protein
MMTRREALRAAAGGLIGAGFVGRIAACEHRTTSTDDAAPVVRRAAGDLLFVETAGGLRLIDASTGRSAITTNAELASPDWSRVASAATTGFGTQFELRDVASGRLVSSGTLRDRLEPRVVSSVGWLVALATPAGRGATTYRPAGRDHTTVVVADTGGERVRIELAGNLEPEAFSTDDRALFVLEYLPPLAPDRYRVRRLNLTTRRLEPLLTRVKVPVPPGAEEEMRGEGRQAVFDRSRHMLFTLYTHQPDHLHTRDLIAGARPGSPGVHAFVHSLHLAEQWAYCIDLPAPFGDGPAAGHAIALSPDGSRLYIVDASRGSIAEIDPDSLTVLAQRRFTADAGPGGEAAAAVTSDGRHLLVGGRGIAAVPLAGATDSDVPPWVATPSPVRGLAVAGDRAYIGQEAAVLWRDVRTGRTIGRAPVPGLVRLRHVTPAR